MRLFLTFVVMIAPPPRPIRTRIATIKMAFIRKAPTSNVIQCAAQIKVWKQRGRGRVEMTEQIIKKGK